MPMTANVEKTARLFSDFSMTSYSKEIEVDLSGNVQERRQVNSKDGITFSCPFLELRLTRRLRNLWMPLMVGKRIEWVE